ncbi:MAG TPA: type II toxin-antitoxin system HicB family antitoxin [Silvibacterium sp.]|jgi:predicted RNase H-like HicB family nuclease|nr:type II toxin-antitoxin system HicB family antitoxin [Silvibacterium sp.]
MRTKYLVVYAKVPHSNFAGHAPDVPGCVSAGDTLDEMRAMMREALESHFEIMLEHGEAIPKPAANSVEFKDEDFDDVEYFVVEHLELKVPTRHAKREAIPA